MLKGIITKESSYKEKYSFFCKNSVFLEEIEIRHYRWSRRAILFLLNDVSPRIAVISPMKYKSCVRQLSSLLNDLTRVVQFTVAGLEHITEDIETCYMLPLHIQLLMRDLVEIEDEIAFYEYYKDVSQKQLEMLCLNRRLTKQHKQELYNRRRRRAKGETVRYDGPPVFSLGNR